MALFEKEDQRFCIQHVCMIDRLTAAGYRTLPPEYTLHRDNNQSSIFPPLHQRRVLGFYLKTNLPSPCQINSGSIYVYQSQILGVVANTTAYESHTRQCRRLELTNHTLEPQKDGGYSTLSVAPGHSIHSL